MSTGNLVRVPVVNVVRGELERPSKLAGLDVKSDDRRRAEVVAETRVAVPVRSGIAGAPVEELERGIVRTGQPRRAAAVHPAVSRPGFAAGFAGRRDGPVAPQLFARLRVVCVEEPSNTRFAAADADDDLVVHDERGGGDGVPHRIFTNVDNPAFDAGSCVERDQVAVEGADEQRVVEHRHPAVDAREAEVEHAAGDWTIPFPQRFAAAHIDRRDRRRASRHVQHAVREQRRRFEGPGPRRLVDP